MGANPIEGTNQRAAVLVIDNQFGHLGVGPEPFNEFGKSIFQEQLEGHYDKVFVIVAHSRNPENNEVVNALKTAASQFGTVDMIVAMHWMIFCLSCKACTLKMKSFPF